MKEFTGEFERIHEETLYRYQQGGFLRGDYAKIKKDALKHESVKGLSEQMKCILQDAINKGTMLRVSYIKSGATESFSGPVDAANIATGELWADCYEEYAPGMWNNVMTVPLGILEKIEIEGANGFPPYNKDLVRGHDPDKSNDDPSNKEMRIQTKGEDENRTLPKNNTKLANTSIPKDGRKQAKFKESNENIGFGKENEVIFETYIATQNR